MNKVIFGLILGGILGAFDGLTALLSAPETAPQIASIVIGSTVKGLIAGVAIGFFARKVSSLPLGLLFGLVVGALLAWLVVYLGGGLYFWEIMIPGAIVGLIVGYATQRYGGAADGRSAGAAAGLLLLAAALPAAAGHEAHGGVDARAAFERLKSLAGRWEGTVGGQPGGVVEYRVAGAGSVVMETLFPGTDHEMISMYHLDGDDLVMVHYCTKGNQPRMKLVAGSGEELVFDYTGGTNLDPAADSYARGGRLRVRGDGHLETSWSFWNAGAETSTIDFVLDRTR